MRNKKEAIVLLSGGLDSATTLYLAREQGYKCFCLIFDYGQRHRKEITAAKKIAQSAGAKFEVVKISLPWKGSSLLDSKIGIPASASGGVSGIPSTYVPARNIIFLSFALSCAEAMNAEAIFIGAHAQDYSGYPDCRPEFYRAFRKVDSCGTKSGVEKRGIKIETPLINKGKAEIIRLGNRLGVPFEVTWSCYKGEKRPCGECDSCYFRKKGFIEAKIKDPQLK
jgi:7-cyano-7-deazaguanine synthase